MLANVVLGGKQYSWREYGCVGLITAGICVFQLYKAGKGDASFADSSAYGVGLLFASLSLDGFTSSNQRLPVCPLCTAAVARGVADPSIIAGCATSSSLPLTR